MKVIFDFQGVRIEREYYQGYIPKVGDDIECNDSSGRVVVVSYDLKKDILTIFIS